MKRVLPVLRLVVPTIVLTLGAVAPCSLAAPADDAKPQVRFFETVHNFGKVQPNKPVENAYIVTNTGNAMLEISEVQPGCGCTSVVGWDKQVAPGKTGRVTIRFNPFGFSGAVSKAFSIVCNDPAQRSHILQFQATVWSPIDVQTHYVHFLPVEGEFTNETKTVRIVNNVTNAVTLQAPRCSSATFQTELKPIRPGFEWELRVTYSGPVSNASLQGSIAIDTSLPDMAALSVSAFVLPQPAIIVTPMRVVLPPGPLAADYRYPLNVRSNSRQPVSISEVTSSVPGITAQTRELELGKAFEVKLSFAPTFQLAANAPAEISIKTTHPRFPMIRVPLTRLAGDGFNAPAAVLPGK